MTDRSPRKSAKPIARAKPLAELPRPNDEARSKGKAQSPNVRPDSDEPRDPDESSSTFSDAAIATSSAIASVASLAGEQVRTVVRGAGELAQHARQAIGERAEQIAMALGERPGARVRRIRRMAKQPLPVLWEIHPEARSAPIREVGIVEVPVEKIRGTAQEVGDRGGDFLPLKDFRGDNWRARWQRILTAVQQMNLLPPVDLIRTGDEYWVVDGHNRVAAALYSGQLSLDANVMDLRLPGSPRPPGPIAPIAPYLIEEMLKVRAAGEGRPVRSEGAEHALIPVAHDHAHPTDDPDEPDKPEDPDRPGDLGDLDDDGAPSR